MSKTTTYRYEVGNESYGVVEHVKKFEEAKTVAHNWIERENTPAYIFDRMAHKNKPELWNVTKCTGAAHSNPWIDHCGVCMPNWGIVVKPVAKDPQPLTTDILAHETPIEQITAQNHCTAEQLDSRPAEELLQIGE